MSEDEQGVYVYHLMILTLALLLTLLFNMLTTINITGGGRGGGVWQNIFGQSCFVAGSLVNIPFPTN